MARAALLLGALLAGSALATLAVGRADDATVVAGCEAGLACTFDPAVLRVAPGATVTWVVQAEGQCHTATSGLSAETELAEALAPDATHLNAFGSPRTCGGQAFSHTFPEGGLYPYYCAVGLHRFMGMHGVVLVQG